MINPQELLHEVDIKPQFRDLPITYNGDLGFMEVQPENSTQNERQIVGFATPFALSGGYDRDNEVEPITNYKDLPDDARSIDKQGKGVGPRLYNVREAFGGTKERPPFIGLYMLGVRMDHSVDMRLHQGTDVRQIARHAERILRSMVFGIERVVGGIHAEYEERNRNPDVDAVMFNVPPHPALRQRAHGVKTPEGIDPRFLIIRNSKIKMIKLGETTSPY